MTETTIINLTNTVIRVYPSEYTDIEIPVSRENEDKFISRCIELPATGHAKSQITRDGDTANIVVKGSKKKIQLSYSHIGFVSGLKEPKEDTIYIVSQLTYNAIFHLRKDIFIIDNPIRKAGNGGVIACRGFSRCVYDKDNQQLNYVENYLKKAFQKLPKGLESDEVWNCLLLLAEYRRK